MDAKADSKETILELLHQLHYKFIEGLHYEWLVVEGDGKLYEIIKSLQFEYGEQLRWVIPYPGDWHMLKNYQSALMKAYFDAGLKALARVSGYPVSAIQTSSHFKRSHLFILEAWEAIYRVMLTHFISKETTTCSESLFHNITDYLKSPHQENFLEDFNHHLQMINGNATQCFMEFKSFLQERARSDDTWRFWVQFIFQDAMAYIGLYLSIRSGDWELRMASMKQMAPVFTAFDQFTYQKLISMHLADLVTIPPAIKAMFKQGRFVVSISDRPWHSVALDESHEMLINRDCKASIVRPLPDYINRIASYIPYRSKSLQNFKQEVLPPAKEKYHSIQSPFSSQSNVSTTSVHKLK